MKFRLIMVGILLVSEIALAEVINRIVAVVNGEVITETELIRYAKKLALNMGKANLDEQIQDKILKNSLQNLIEDKLLLSFGKKMNLKVNKAEVEKRISKIKKNFVSEFEFLQALEEDGLSYQGLYQRIQDDILKKMVIDLFVRKKIEIHPEELKHYYQTHLEEFLRPGRIKARKIYIKKAEATERKVEQIRELLLKKVPFEELAQNHSDSKSITLNQGEWIEKGVLKKTIEEKIFNLKPGDVSPVIETENGYYIFQIIAKEPPLQKTFEEVKNEVYEALYRMKFKEEFQKFIENLKSNAQIEIKI